MIIQKILFKQNFLINIRVMRMGYSRFFFWEFINININIIAHGRTIDRSNNGLRHPSRFKDSSEK